MEKKDIMRILTIIAATLGLWIAAIGISHAQDSYAPQKVVYHINSDGG